MKRDVPNGRYFCVRFKVSVPLRRISDETLANAYNWLQFESIKFPSPCGELVMKPLTT